MLGTELAVRTATTASLLVLTATLSSGCGTPQRRSTPNHPVAPTSTPGAPSPQPGSAEPIAVPDRSVCGPGEREDVFSLACAVEPVPGSNVEERRGLGWPNADFALVCNVVEPCGRIPPAAPQEAFMLDNREFGGWTVSDSGRSLRAAFSPGEPVAAGACTPRSYRFRTPLGNRPAAADDSGGPRWPHLLDVRGATRGTQMLLGDLELTTFTIDMTAYCRDHPETWSRRGG